MNKEYVLLIKRRGICLYYDAKNGAFYSKSNEGGRYKIADNHSRVFYNRMGYEYVLRYYECLIGRRLLSFEIRNINDKIYEANRQEEKEDAD
jgi:hypothetical protein